VVIREQRKISEILHLGRISFSLLSVSPLSYSGHDSSPELALTISQLLTGLAIVTPMVLKEWQAWTALREARREQEAAREDERQRRVEERERQQWERDVAAEKHRLEVERELAREREILALREELEAQRSQPRSSSQLGTVSIPILDLLALPNVQSLLKSAKS